MKREKLREFYVRVGDEEIRVNEPKTWITTTAGGDPIYLISSEQIFTEYTKKTMKTKKHKVEIPEGYEFDRKWNTNTADDGKTTTVVFKKVKKELPKTWEEYCISKGKKPWITKINYQDCFTALRRLIELRDVYNDGWVPDWNEENTKYTITNTRNKIDKSHSIYGNYILTFKTHELRVEFLSNFAQLIETAKPLL